MFHNTLSLTDDPYLQVYFVNFTLHTMLASCQNIQLRWLGILSSLFFLSAVFFGASHYLLFCPVEDQAVRPFYTELLFKLEDTIPKANLTWYLEQVQKAKQVSKKVRCAIYTYFQPLGEWSRTRKDQELIRLWQRNWYSQGLVSLVFNTPTFLSFPFSFQGSRLQVSSFLLGISLFEISFLRLEASDIGREGRQTSSRVQPILYPLQHIPVS